MRNGRTVLRLLSVMALIVAVLAAWQVTADRQRAAAGEKKTEAVEKKGGMLTGVVTAKDLTGKPPYIEVKADGEAKGRKYTPQWIGKAGGGFDKKTMADIAAVKVGSRVRLVWSYDERPRVLSIEVLKAAVTPKN